MKIAIVDIQKKFLMATFGILALTNFNVSKVSAQSTDITVDGKFGRMFTNLPPFAPPTDEVVNALLGIGAVGGILDAFDCRTGTTIGPGGTIITCNVNNPDNPNMTSGETFMGQFLDHDITFDRTSRLGVPTRPQSAPNARTPIFDLDSVYGSGPSGSPEFYDLNDRIKFKVENGGQFEDLPRRLDSVAIIGDPRNDENVITAGLHAAFLLFHNHMVDVVRSENLSLSNEGVFNRARQLTTFHYQWMILHQFLPDFVGQPLINDILANGRQFYKPKQGPFIPVEFQLVYRFGHSLVRPGYRANLAGMPGGLPFLASIFDNSIPGTVVDRDDLLGGSRAPRRFVGWQSFFNFGDGQVKPNKKIDTHISSPLFKLPLAAIFGGTPPIALPQRTLLRHLTWQMPSGQAIAAAMHIAHPLDESNLQELAPFKVSENTDFVTNTPLWYYILKEAEVQQNGLRLGSVGGRIVGEVFIGLLQLDPNSYLNVAPNWVPTVPTTGGTPALFQMTDFLRFARVDPISRGQ